MHMQAAKLGTAVQMRKHLAGIQQMIGIKSAFQTLLLFHIIFGKLDRHQITFFNANAMFASQYTTHFDTAPQNIGAKILGPRQFARLVGIKQDQRVQIAVTRMKDIGHTQPVFLAECCHQHHHIGQTPPRDGAIHTQIIWRNPPDSRKSRFAPGPK